MRFGIRRSTGSCRVSSRTRRRTRILPAIHPPRPGRWGLRSTHPGGAWSRGIRRSDVLGLEGTPTLGAPVSDREERRLLHFHPAPDLLELLLCRLGLGDLLLHGFGRTVHEILGLLEPETGQLNARPRSPGSSSRPAADENDVEFRLLLLRPRRRPPPGRGDRNRRRRRHAPLLLQHLRELGCLEQGSANLELLDDLFDISRHVRWPPV